ncbi:MAG: hypothetical protein V3T72_06590, partial [Thermoanaerobaculia bacterium]
MQSLLRLWFGLRTPVRRLPYVLSGFGLMVLKYAVDYLLVLKTTATVWTPFDYLNPLGIERFEALSETSDPTLWLLAIWTLPFVWIGASMSVRRAVNAGLAPWTGLLFFVPLVNYLVMVWLCLLPETKAPNLSAAEVDPGERQPLTGGFADGLRAGLLGILVALAMMATSIFLLKSYGVGLFVGTPFVMGFVCGVFFNRPTPRPLKTEMIMVTLSLACLGGLLLLFALEGVLCIAMAFPLAWVLAVVGAWMGHGTMAAGTWARTGASLMILLLPLMMGAEAVHNQAPLRKAPLREAVTAVEIDAPPEVVWESVVGFGELPPPARWVFRTGIAYPMRARLEGRGAGAIRYCEFSTGAFVEPITVWDPPRRLAFDVSSQPPPMHEWSPYETVHAPHLLDGFRSERGEFRLIALADGRTRLEGSTWYRIDLFPQAYWGLFA